MAMVHELADENRELRRDNSKLMEGIGKMAEIGTALLDSTKAIEKERDELRSALRFAQSVIKSREGWSPACEEVIGRLLDIPAYSVETATEQNAAPDCLQPTASRQRVS